MSSFLRISEAPPNESDLLELPVRKTTKILKK